jgi:hypothetical protein
MSPHFGSKVTGHEAYEQAVRNEVGGGNVFGVRVRGAINGSGPTNDAKRVSEFGVGVVQHAQASDEEGNTGDTVSIESLRNILAENPTFLDSLYEAELAREEGPRPEALGIIYEVERGIKGQMRPDVMNEIKSLMGQGQIDADQLANQIAVRAQAQEEMLKRTEENRLLADAPRIAALRDRANDLKTVKEAQDSGVATQVGFTTEAQEQRIATEQGVSMPGDVSTATATGTVPAKPDGNTNVESQQPGDRLGVPKGTSGTDAGGSSASGASPATGAASADQGTGADTTDSQSVEPDDFTVAELREALKDRIDSIKGTGSDGAVVKADLVKAAKKGLKDGSLKVQSGYLVTV